MRKKILFICGSFNQTTQMYAISEHLSSRFDCYFTPFYCDGFYYQAQKLGLMDFTIAGGQNRRAAERFLAEKKAPIDYGGEAREYDLYVTCTDLIVPKNIMGKNVVLVQEGMTDPENMAYKIIKAAKKIGVHIPMWLASTSTTGMSDAYRRFCVASDGYRDHFVNKGVKREKIVVTGIPNFDHAEVFLNNDFPHKDYVLVATTDTRENFKWDNRRKFLERAVEIANGSQMIFRLHPNEKHDRSTAEIEKYAPGSIVYKTGNTAHMIANCHTLITQFSSVVYLGLALGKQVYSYFDLDELKRLAPIQNQGRSAENIARVCEGLL